MRLGMQPSSRRTTAGVILAVAALVVVDPGGSRPGCQR